MPPETGHLDTAPAADVVPPCGPHVQVADDGSEALAVLDIATGEELLHVTLSGAPVEPAMALALGRSLAIWRRDADLAPARRAEGILGVRAPRGDRRGLRLRAADETGQAEDPRRQPARLHGIDVEAKKRELGLAS